MTLEVYMTRNELAEARPAWKWVGGKSQLIEQYKPLFPKKFTRYFEPFVGAGAVFFHLKNRFPHMESYLSDVNWELVQTFRAIRNSKMEVIAALREYQAKHSKDFYYAMRAENARRMVSWDIAARFIYLNKTCFNGLYRVNRKGEFNVPMGSYKNPLICDEANLHNVSRALQSVEVTYGDFRETLTAWKDDFVYFDPPYVPVSKTANFTSYSQDKFTEKDQTDLRDVFADLAKKGAHVMLSNSDTPFVHELYKGFNITKVSARRSINSKGDKRGAVGEVVVRNYE